ncbi:MAG: DUF1963 domain-containing protein [Microcoleus sp. PH2017_10_PVI_O_A]|uniref:YwqG family protein n=1 Tax=unclassified Microcoleus TaxID=2642155 RepID=UPI001E0AA2E7|nr:MULTISPECIES: DUF1963 domain-containing protein [unclassified Microcoleus]TAE80419.1 MAG: DUF1963 domain-containing protein [Oscillatoriales cyanobacterium]MCC3407612.1 DUF1963 domain-containing protein [Microcoleus sp. PH2017_10_PVI_O_A]MCC3461790.1 DUF1963 domain-containing protein [Microcoleus sp. PH2017_11_PCY_U_A]MCC3480204.1 DUF1963 domain-containing protein [Microcoleus sp. PH2017_12_PCY_D_A]MCC3526571.1 DUF1963 domain-containing protein [Microcoleus sp. PH2017_21_RUC_O_A]
MNYKLEVPLSPKLEKYRARIESTIKPYIEITIENNEPANWWQSKFGGLPYLPKGFDYPKTPHGDYLFLLAQINFSEVPHLEDFPDRGILQFYLPDDELYGLSFDYDEDIFKILYFPEPDFNVENIITNYDFLPKFEYVPIWGSCRLQFTKKYAPITHYDDGFTKFLGEDFYKLFREDDEVRDNYINLCVPHGHKIGGYHGSFQSNDPRLDCESDPYILLFQMDSDGNDAIDIMWGDGGVGNFFVKESALQKLDFSDVVYEWDCG